MRITRAEAAQAAALEAAFQPVRLYELELSQPWPAIEASPAHGRRARVLARLHGAPLGVVEAPDGGPEALAERLWAEVGAAINHHLEADRLAPLHGLEVGALVAPGEAPCLDERRRIIAAAPGVSVVVCTRDRTDLLAVCLPSLLALDYADFEIILVDNAPRTSATADLVAAQYADQPRLRYVREDRPGLSWARNRGLAEARREIIAFTDDDARADPWWLAELARGFASAPDVACVTGATLPAELETASQAWFEQWGGFNKYRGWQPQTVRLSAPPADDPFFPYLTPRYGAGVNMAFRRQTLADLGGFDPALGAGTPTSGAEDIEAFLRVLLAGHALRCQPTALLYHTHRREFAALHRQLFGCGKALTAYVAACVAADRRHLWRMIGMLRHAPGHLLGKQSGRNRAKRSDYPRALTRAELTGMLYGPWAYAQSRRLAKKMAS